MRKIPGKSRVLEIDYEIRKCTCFKHLKLKGIFDQTEWNYNDKD